MPLEDFIPERKRLAAELRAAKEREAAAELGKVPKPTPAAWAVNHVARAAPDVVERWAASAAMLRDASANPKATGGDGLRAAMAAHRASTNALADTIRELAHPGGRPLSSSMLDRSVALLHAAVADAELSNRVVAGWVSEEKAVTPPPPQRAIADPDVAPVPKVDPRRGKLERQVAERVKEVERLRDAATERDAAVQAAGEQLEEATRRLRRKESEAAAAHHALEEAAAHLQDLRTELEDL